MKTSTLRQLVDSLTEVQHYHLASALLESDPVRRSHAHDRAHRVGAVLDAVRFELSARATRGARATDAARRAERYLQHLLADFLELGEPDEVARMAHPAPLRADPRAHAGIAVPSAAIPAVESGRKHASSVPDRRQAGERIG